MTILLPQSISLKVTVEKSFFLFFKHSFVHLSI